MCCFLPRMTLRGILLALQGSFRSSAIKQEPQSARICHQMYLIAPLTCDRRRFHNAIQNIDSLK